MQIRTYTQIHTNMHRYIKDTNACTRNIHYTFKLYIAHVNVLAYLFVCDDIKSWVIKSTCGCYIYVYIYIYADVYKLNTVMPNTHMYTPHTHTYTNTHTRTYTNTFHKYSHIHIYTRTNTQTFSPSRSVFLALCLARSLTFSFYLPSLTLSLSLSLSHTHTHTAMAMLDDVMEAMAKFPGAGDRYVASFMPRMLLSAMSFDVG